MPPASERVLRGRRVVTPTGVRPASVHVRGETVVAVSERDQLPVDCPVDDVGDAVLMPGIVDCHVHINEPGRTDWEGFESATRAAAAGGITTLVDMPLNSIPATTSCEGLQAKTEAADGRCMVDVACWGGVVPGNTHELAALRAAGVTGFKCFLCPSGVAEFEHVTEEHLRPAMRELARLDAPLLVHAELPALLEPLPAPGHHRRRYAGYLATRPPEAEREAVALIVRLCRELGAHVHIVHVSAASALEALAAARAESLPVTAETCPHYLHFSAEEVPDGATELKCAPPLRDAKNRELLWSGLRDGVLDMVVSDHSPCPPSLKERDTGDFIAAWGGIASLQLGLPITWTGARARGFALTDVVRWMCEAPARLAGLGARKGAIAPGYDADFVVWNPEQASRVDPDRLHHRHRLTPYAGVPLDGVVQATYLRGKKIYERGTFAGAPRGRMLTRTGP
ncbi:MAG TPA: allantoinase AllB [Gemmatimonadaceae bacterium]|nr:allantoinase AllB [Gemmatimonadaceae bacterium]